MSRRWLEVTQSLAGEAALVGLVDVFPEAAQKRKAELALPEALPVFADLGEALAALRPDAVFDCTVPEAHHRVALAAFAAGAHVLSEKPLATTLADARAGVAAAQAAGRLYAVTQNYRYSRAIRSLRELLRSGAVGELHTLYADFFRGAHFGGFREQMEHVLLLDMAIHSFDMARFLSGADPVEVFAREFNPPGSWYRHGACANADFAMTGGVHLSYRGSWCAEGADTPWNCAWRLVGTQGTILWDGADRITAKRVAGDTGFSRPLAEVPAPLRDFPGQQDAHASVIAEFVRCVRHGGQPETHAADNLHSLAMVLGAVASAERGQPVRLADL